MNQAIADWAKNIIMIDDSELLHSFDPMLSFAKDELLCKQVSANNNISICRIWRHPNAFILGQQDARLPYAKQAMEWLKAQGILPIVRNSGGAAVPLDHGVVNISLIFPTEPDGQAQFKQDFEKMFQLISASLASTGTTVIKGEIEGAYCPGDYDLSVGGRKFCGIAQRRLLRAYCIQAFVIASGIGKQRTGLVRHFYEIAAGGDPHAKHPRVTDESTASLAELTSLEAPEHSSFIAAIKEIIHAHKNRMDRESTLADGQILLPSDHEIEHLAQQLKERYSFN